MKLIYSNPYSSSRSVWKRVIGCKNQCKTHSRNTPVRQSSTVLTHRSNPRAEAISGSAAGQPTQEKGKNPNKKLYVQWKHFLQQKTQTAKALIIIFKTRTDYLQSPAALQWCPQRLASSVSARAQTLTLLSPRWLHHRHNHPSLQWLFYKPYHCAPSKRLFPRTWTWFYSKSSLLQSDGRKDNKT